MQSLSAKTIGKDVSSNVSRMPSASESDTDTDIESLSKQGTDMVQLSHQSSSLHIYDQQQQQLEINMLLITDLAFWKRTACAHETMAQITGVSNELLAFKNFSVCDEPMGTTIDRPNVHIVVAGLELVYEHPNGVTGAIPPLLRKHFKARYMKSHSKLSQRIPHPVIKCDTFMSHTVFSGGI